MVILLQWIIEGLPCGINYEAVSRFPCDQACQAHRVNPSDYAWHSEVATRCGEKREVAHYCVGGGIFKRPKNREDGSKLDDFRTKSIAPTRTKF